MAGAARRGKSIPTMAFRKPTASTESWRQVWHKHLHWKSWQLDRQGGGYTPRH